MAAVRDLVLELIRRLADDVKASQALVAGQIWILHASQFVLAVDAVQLPFAFLSFAAQLLQIYSVSLQTDLSNIRGET